MIVIGKKPCLKIAL